MRRSLVMNARNDPGPAIAAAPPSRNGARRAAGGEAMHVAVIGAGVAGLACASELAERGAAGEGFERWATVGEGASGRTGPKAGSASCRAGVCHYVWISGVAGPM